MAVTQVVVDSNARDLTVTLVKASDGTSIGTPSSATLIGKSDDLPGSPISQAMTINANVVSLVGFGALVTAALLGNRSSALYTFEIKYVISAKTDRSRRFQYQWIPALG